MCTHTKRWVVLDGSLHAEKCGCAQGQNYAMEMGDPDEGADFIPEKRMVRWEPQAPPRVQSSGRGCSQSGSGKLMAVDMAS